MTSLRSKISTADIFRKIFQFFLQGIIVIAPIGITIYAVLWLFQTVDNILPNIISTLFPQYLSVDSHGDVKKIPGLGFLVFIAIVVIVGWISSSFVVSRLVDVLDTVLEKTPGIKFIYTSVKDFLEAFAGNKKKFDKPVMVNVDNTGVWRIGFITQTTAKPFELADHAVVYVPHSYAISGITYIVPLERIKPLSHTSAAEAMKFTLSGGITHVE
jgi:uncharacterized membrane protein